MWLVSKNMLCFHIFFNYLPLLLLPFFHMRKVSRFGLGFFTVKMQINMSFTEEEEL